MKNRANAAVLLFVLGLVVGWLSNHILPKQLGAETHAPSASQRDLQGDDSKSSPMSSETRNYDMVVFSALEDREMAFRIERKSGQTFGVSGSELVEVQEEAEPPVGFYELKVSSVPGRTKFYLVRLECLSGRMWSLDHGKWSEIKNKIINK